jgi:hypothetical protein
VESADINWEKPGDMLAYARAAARRPRRRIEPVPGSPASQPSALPGPPALFNGGHERAFTSLDTIAPLIEVSQPPGRDVPP